MGLYRRAGARRLDGVLGEPALDADRQMRTFGLARVAAQEPPLLREDTHAALQAYADGVNKFLEGHSESLPIEFIIFGYRPYPWTVVDSIVVAKLQVYDAANNYTQELLRASLAKRFGTGVLGTLMPDPTTASRGASPTRTPTRRTSSLNARIRSIRDATNTGAHSRRRPWCARRSR